MQTKILSYIYKTKLVCIPHNKGTSPITLTYSQKFSTFYFSLQRTGSINKLALYGTEGQLLRTDVSANFKVTWHKTWDKNQKSGHDKFWILCPNLRMCGHLPAPTVNGGGDSLQKWPNFRLSRARDLDLDLGSGHTAYRHASLIDRYLHTKFHSSQRNFLWTDGHTDGRTDIRNPLY